MIIIILTSLVVGLISWYRFQVKVQRAKKKSEIRKKKKDLEKKIERASVNGHVYEALELLDEYRELTRKLSSGQW